MATKSEMEKLQKQINTCKAMAEVCKARKDGLLETFYAKAKKGFEKKLFRAQMI